MERIRNKVLEVNIVFLVVSILFITLGSFVQYLNVEIGIIITEYILLLGPMLLVLFLRKEKIKSGSRLNKINFKQIILTILIAICVLPIALFANSLMFLIMKKFGMNAMIPTVPTADTGIQYLKLFFVIAVSAGVCEELFFRGFVLCGYKEKHINVSVFVSAFLFAILHFNLGNFLSPLVLGIVYGYIVHITDSVYSSMIAHTIHNGIIVTYMYILSTKFSYLMDEATGVNPTTAITFSAVISLLVIALIFVALVILLVKKLASVSKNNGLEECNYVTLGINKNKREVMSYIPLLLPIALYLFFNLSY